jgi:hypothetical protein
MQKCLCGKDTKTFEACTPLGCNAVLLCLGCYKQVEKCVCQNNNNNNHKTNSILYKLVEIANER